jgi:hypothetical protein
MHDIDRIRELAAAWNANDDEMEALWQREGKPRGKAWAELAADGWAKTEAIEDELAPLLFDWATAEGLIGLSVFGNLVIEYAKVKKATGIRFHGSRIRTLIENEMGERQQAAWEERLRSMTEDEFTDYMDGFCTVTDEGKALKQYALDFRATDSLERGTTRGNPADTVSRTTKMAEPPRPPPPTGSEGVQETLRRTLRTTLRKGSPTL